MRYTLKGYQNDALADLLTALRHAKTFYSATETPYPQAVTLTATMGAGKTVIATAAIESLFYGNEDLDFPEDETAVVLWFSSNPALNAQSRDRLRSASDKLTTSNLVTVETTFDEPVLDTRTVYFLNHSKLSKNSLLVRGDRQAENATMDTLAGLSSPDGRASTFWDTLRNTIEHPHRTLYMFLDEAHEGMGEQRRTKQDRLTLVRRVIDGQGDVPSVPIVVGLTATPGRFKETAERAWVDQRNTLRDLQVDSSEVQASGLIKDQVALDFSPESGDFDTVLLRKATRQLRDMTARWDDYSGTQEEGETVAPLMILQVPNTPDPDDVAEALDTIRQTWPRLLPENFAHVLGEHATQQFGPYKVRYVAPERVQDEPSIRVLIAKDAISTGWDCPRAEVMISFRPASDRTYITQLLGRMIRTPLARRIPGDDVLGAVYCYLPKFDRETTEQIAIALEKGEDGSSDPKGAGRRVLINPQPYALPVARDDQGEPVTDTEGKVVLAEGVEDTLSVLETLPSQSITRAITKPVKRLTRLAHELTTDGLLETGNSLAHEEMHAILDGLRARYARKLDEALEKLYKVRLSTMYAQLGPRIEHEIQSEAQRENDKNPQSRREDASFERADDKVIEHAFKTAERVFGSPVARSYVRHLAAQNAKAEDAYEALIEAEGVVTALAALPKVKEDFDEAAEQLAEEWFTKFRVGIRGLSQARQATYREIQLLSREPQVVELARPETWLEPTQSRVIGGALDTEPEDLPTFAKHLLTDEEGLFPGEFNDWETEVLKTEIARDSTVFWFRNPSQAKPESLGIAYTMSGDDKILRPDFLIFSRNGDELPAVSIVDPHRHDYTDSLPKLQGLARYAEKHGDRYARIEALSKIGDTLRVLDLQEPAVRKAVLDAESDAKPLYLSQHARNYV
ncbi:DEAD/DEAH box helicase [Kocuria sp. UCD-OTCP]|uniref:DEAD/DEAH box helicase n=1 Tax=Kocuria sp. UCD-OTCP TaxID=1292021 RepID=UPI00036B5EF3|nr:DEAD/DEAH box helicase family protein [Kocuria sp. UCD-OTCP]EYT53517.1 type III restriction enzyme, res subunit [Kocuria sp. UCD-OTCP]